MSVPVRDPITTLTYVLYAIALALGSAATIAVFDPQPAYAVVVPDYGASRYITTPSGSGGISTSSNAYALGCEMGGIEYNRSGSHNDLIALQFGGVNRQSDGTYKASIYGGTDVQLRPGVVRIAENYARGFFACTSGDTGSIAELALVTSNDLDGNTTDAGAAWSGMVSAFDDWLSTDVSGQQVEAWGGFDIEDGFSGPSGARNLVNGYAASYSTPYINTGDAGGCPDDHIPSATECGTTDFPAWGPDDIYYVSWGATPAYTSPEIYREDGSNAQQWYWLTRWGIANPGHVMQYIGVTVQHDSCFNGHSGCSGLANTVSQGYTQLYNALQQNAQTAQTPDWTTNFGWDYDHF